MANFSSDYYIYVLRTQLDAYKTIHCSGPIQHDEKEKIIYMFNVHSKQLAKLAIYLYHEKPIETDKCVASDMCKKMQDCVYKAQNIMNYISNDGRLSDLSRTLTYN